MKLEKGSVPRIGVRQKTASGKFFTEWVSPYLSSFPPSRLDLARARMFPWRNWESRIGLNTFWTIKLLKLQPLNSIQRCSRTSLEVYARVLART